VLILTAIVVGVAMLALGLAIVARQGWSALLTPMNWIVAAEFQRS